MCIYAPLGGTFVGPLGVKFTDVKQSDVYRDCYLCAALSSAAWVNPTNISNQAGPNYTFTFTKWAGGRQVQPPIAVDNVVATTVVGARSTEVNEIWPAIYEKAYAIYMLLPQEPGCGNPTHRDLSKFPVYNPVTTLAELSGQAPVTFLTQGDNDPTGSTTLSKIAGICNSKKTRYPAAAITNAAPGNGLNPSHSYSILGVQDSNIILRDPHLVVPNGNIFTGMWTGVVNVSYSNGNQIGGAPPSNFNLATIPGVFGIDKALFYANFQSYGWVGW